MWEMIREGDRLVGLRVQGYWKPGKLGCRKQEWAESRTAGMGVGESIPLLCASSWDREFTATLHRAQ